MLVKQTTTLLKFKGFNRKITHLLTDESISFHFISPLLIWAQNIAILLIIKGIVIVNVREFCYI